VFLHQTQIRRVGFRFVQVGGKGGREGGRGGMTMMMEARVRGEHGEGKEVG
jgi:6-phosphogluconate dehydrogenase (decarboxylating)